MRPGATILLDDGLLSVEVEDVRGERVTGVVRYGGLLKPNKGINLPGVEVSAPAISERDAEEVERAVAAGADFIAMSFVQRGEDVEALRRLVPSSVRIIAKIEKDTALRNIKGILRAADAIMVARGDLGVELPFEEVPLTQKRLIREANLHGKPVITATQMLESMVHAPRPTRAEASDVANAILDGTDAVMLSAETAVGDYPRGVGRGDGPDRPRARAPAARAQPGVRHRRRPPGGEDGPAAERRRRRGHDDAHRVGDCRRGLRGRRPVAGARPSCASRPAASPPAPSLPTGPSVPILAVTPEPETFRQLSLVWGVVPVLVQHFPSLRRAAPGGTAATAVTGTCVAR